ISRTLKQGYRAESAIVVPGSGTFGMEAVARQFATGKHCLVIRNGWFSFRWSQIFDMGSIPASTTVLTAEQKESGPQAPFSPPPIESVVATIREHKPDLVFAAHVETASGIMLPPAYPRAVADAVHEHGGLFVLDCIASGAIWVDMQEAGVDILISAPQKGWSGPACAGLREFARCPAAARRQSASRAAREGLPQCGGARLRGAGRGGLLYRG